MFVNNAPRGQVAMFAIRDIGFAVGNHARREIHEKRTGITGRNPDGNGIRAEGSLCTTERENASAALGSTPNGDNADTARRGGFFGVFTDSADMPSPRQHRETVPRLLRLLNSAPNCPSSRVMSKTALAINVQYVLSFAQHLRFRRWDNAPALNAFQIRGDAEHAVRIVPGEIGFEENLGDILGNVLRRTGRHEYISRECLKTRDFQCVHFHDGFPPL